MLRVRSSPDPAADAAALLRRLGFATLFFSLPIGAVLSRRAIVLLFPIGVALLVAAALLDRDGAAALGRTRSLARSIGARTAIAGLAWGAASLLWVQAPVIAAERLAGFAGTLAIAGAAFVALPERTRSANLYLLPLGTAIAAALALLSRALGYGSLLDHGAGEDAVGLERGLAMLTLVLWPSMGWLRSRGRDLEAGALALLCAVAAAAGGGPYIVLALATGAVAFALASGLPRRGAILVAALAGLAILLAPALAFLGAWRPASGAALWFWPAALDGWRAAILADPVRLVTGHGVGALALDRANMAVLPDTPVLQLWYDLGIVGAAIVASGIAIGMLSATETYAPLLASVAGAVATAATLTVASAGAGQAWEAIAVCVIALAFVAARRGQYRTRRPAALLPSGRG